MFFTLVTAVHIASGSLWVGGSLLLLLRPVWRRYFPGSVALRLTQLLAQGFRDIVEIGLWVLIITGTLLSFEALTEATVPTSYVAVLVLKLFLFGWMALIALNLWERVSLRRGSRQGTREERNLHHRLPIHRAFLRWADSPVMQVLLGLTVLFLAEMLRLLAP